MLNLPYLKAVLLRAYLDHCITLYIVFETFELKVEYRRERLENDTFFGILETVTFGLIFIVTL